MANIAKLIGGAYSTPWGTAVFNAADLNGLVNGDAVLSSAADFDNTTNLDLLMALGLNLTIASSPLTAGAAIYLYQAILNPDGSTYGDGAFVAGTPAAHTPGLQPVGSIAPTITGAAQTAIVGSVPLVALARKKFRIMLFNQLGFALATTAGNVYLDTSNFNLNG